jgi:hypothetical protein
MKEIPGSHVSMCATYIWRSLLWQQIWEIICIPLSWGFRIISLYVVRMKWPRLSASKYNFDTPTLIVKLLWCGILVSKQLKYIYQWKAHSVLYCFNKYKRQMYSIYKEFCCNIMFTFTDMWTLLIVNMWIVGKVTTSTIRLKTDF